MQTPILDEGSPLPPPSERQFIESLMRRRFISVEPEDSGDDVLRLMAFARLRFLPVVSRGVLVGLVGYGALARWRLRDATDGRTGSAPRIAELMEQPRGAVAARSPTEAAAHRLYESGQGCVPVVEPSAQGPRIVGLVTEHDLLVAAYGARPSAPPPRP